MSLSFLGVHFLQLSQDASIFRERVYSHSAYPASPPLGLADLDQRAWTKIWIRFFLTTNHPFDTPDFYFYPVLSVPLGKGRIPRRQQGSCSRPEGRERIALVLLVKYNVDDDLSYACLRDDIPWLKLQGPRNARVSSGAETLIMTSGVSNSRVRRQGRRRLFGVSSTCSAWRAAMRAFECLICHRHVNLRSRADEENNFISHACSHGRIMRWARLISSKGRN